MNMYKNKPMAHHETNLLTRFTSAILQETSTKSQPWQIPVYKSTTATCFFFTTSVPDFCRQSMFCTFKRTCCTVSWFGWQFRLSHEDIKHIGSAAKTTLSPIDMSCRSHQLVQLISVGYIGQKNAATKHGDTSSALHKGCCFKSVWSFLGVINK